MKKRTSITPSLGFAGSLLCALLLVQLCISEVAATDGTAAHSGSSAIFVYGAISFCSLLLAAGYCIVEKKQEWKFSLLYISVFVANAGFFILSVSETLTLALFANLLSYVGGASSLLLMLIIIMDACYITREKPLP